MTSSEPDIVLENEKSDESVGRNRAEKSDIEKKIGEIAYAKGVFLKHYNSAKEQFLSLMDRQSVFAASGLKKTESSDPEGRHQADSEMKIIEKDTIRSLSKAIKLILN